MYYVYQNAGKLDEMTKKLIDDMVEKCEIYKKNGHSDSKSSVAVDFKVIWDKYVLWMVCGFTKFIRGVVLKSKTPENVIKSFLGSWGIYLGLPMVGFWADYWG